MAEAREMGAATRRYEPLLRPAEAADMLGIALGTLYNWSSQRKLPVVKLGGRIRFRREALERFAAKRERQPVAR